MLTMRLLLLSAALLVGSPAPAGAQAYMFETGATLLAKCRNKAPEYGLACTAYIAGVVDGIRKDMFIGRARPVCWPDRMSADEARKTVIAYLERWPDQRTAPASVLVSVALNERWSCQK
ncbi:MAG: Rap1a/Tai family immunity protein [Pseudomonadota bacterium]|nr:Rap1a/Tai family immunity protein [Pseudomonadota bacterium]